MIKLNSNAKKLSITIILEIIFTLAVIFLLIFVKNQSVDYLSDIQSFSGDINKLEQDLSTQNLTSYDQQYAQEVLDNVDSILNKALLIIRVVLPLSLIMLSIIFYFFIWKIVSNVSFKRFIYSSIIPILLSLASLYFALNYIAFKFQFVSESPLLFLIISLILLILTYYISLFFLSNNESFYKNLKLARKGVLKLLLQFTINILINAVYPILVFILFFLAFVKAPIFIVSLLLLIFIIIINLQRIYLYGKIKKIN